MPIELRDIVDRRYGSSGNVPYTDDDEFPSSFPLSRWNLQAQRYLKYWDQFTGQVWEETVPDAQDKDGNPVLRYPLQINYVKTAAQKQNSVLFGEVSDTTFPLVPMRCKSRSRHATTGEKEDALEIEDLVNYVWEENAGRALQQEGGLISQFLGGIVYRIAWEPYNEELEYGIRIEEILPDFFLPVWDTGRPDDLLEAWIVWRVPAREAHLKYGFDLKEGTTDPLYVEHWTKDSYTLLLGGKPLAYTYQGYKSEGDVASPITITYDHEPNPFGFVPFVYIPRKRAGSYYGLSMIDDLEGLAKELNARIADLGDIIHDTAQRNLYAANIPGSVRVRDLAGEEQVIDLGLGGPGQPEPTVFAVDPPKFPSEMANFPKFLADQFGHDSNLPPIAFGEDQGSQRSGTTLFVRFWPLVSEARSQRTHWTVGLIRIAKMIAKIAVLKGIGGITAKHLAMKRWEPDWSPMLPRDREQNLNEVIMSLKEHILDPIDALKKLDLVSDPEESIEKAKIFYEWLIAQEAMLKSGPDGSSGQNQQGVKEQISQPTVQAGVDK